MKIKFNMNKFPSGFDISILFTVLMFICSSRVLAKQQPTEIAGKLIESIFCGWVFSTLWCAIVTVVIAIPINGIMKRKSTDEGAKKVLILSVISFLLIWFQFYVFGSGLPICFY